MRNGKLIYSEQIRHGFTAADKQAILSALKGHEKKASYVGLDVFGRTCCSEQHNARRSGQVNERSQSDELRRGTLESLWQAVAFGNVSSNDTASS